MKRLWMMSQQRLAAKAAEKEVLPQLNAASAGAVKATTGLGLPLCRGFAQASGGWIGLCDEAEDSMTHLWCVLEVKLTSGGSSSGGGVGQTRMTGTVDDRSIAGRSHATTDAAPCGPLQT